MNTYRMVYRCKDGNEDEEIVYAANSREAFAEFAQLEIDDVVSVECFIEDDDEDDYE